MPYLDTRTLEEERDATDDTQVHDEITTLFDFLQNYHYENPHFGITLIPEDEWVEYTKTFVEDVYGKPKFFSDDEWPWRHSSIDWEAAAEELKGDYIEVEFRGKTYIAV